MNLLQGLHKSVQPHMNTCMRTNLWAPAGLQWSAEPGLDQRGFERAWTGNECSGLCWPAQDAFPRSVSMHASIRFIKAFSINRAHCGNFFHISILSKPCLLGFHKLLWITRRCHYTEPKTIDPDWLYWSAQVHTDHLKTNERQLQWNLDTILWKMGEDTIFLILSCFANY